MSVTVEESAPPLDLLVASDGALVARDVARDVTRDEAGGGSRVGLSPARRWVTLPGVGGRELVVWGDQVRLEDVPSLLDAHAGRVTERSLPVLELVSRVLDLVSSGLVLPAAGPASSPGSVWELAPDAEHGDAFDEALARLARSGPGVAAAHSLVRAVVGSATRSWPRARPAAGVSRREFASRASLAKARARAGMRLVVGLSRDGSGAWCMQAGFVPLEPGPGARRGRASGRARGLAAASVAWTGLPAPLSSPHALPLGPVGELAVQEARVLAELAPAFPLLVPGARPAAALSDELVVLSGSAWESLDVWVRALASSGALVLVEGKALRQASLKRRVKGSQGQSTGLLAPGRLGLSAEVTVGGVAVDPAAADSLMCVDGQWVVMSRGEVAAARGLAAAVKRGVSTADLLLDAAFEGVEIDADVFSLAVAPRRVRVPRGFGASLRPYQRDGLDWLSWLEENGLGGVLADEMGLGKTVQCLARIQADHPGPTLVVAPFSLLSNWVSEAARFTPGLRVGVFHGTSRPKVGDLDVVVTTYQTLARSPLLAAVSWHRVIADEAQTVKNPVTAAHRALRGLTASHRLMVTGTPVENHVGDLHSLASLVMPGLLGPRASFMRKFGAFGADVEVVRAVMEPFMLRRVKADVLKDLPGKSVVTVECALSQEQVSVYEREHASMLEGVGGRAGVARAGAVLSGLLRLKQACVHPSLVPGSPGSGFAARSGKVVELERIVRSALGSGEAVVVFTQFAEVIPALAAHLESVTGQRVVTLDGSMSKRARDASLAAFADPSGPPVLVCSLKTGGVGLNLVRACHVVHLDRWWNPAVEDQASDRVWRIGQLRAVTVHLLVCPGTLEDRIDELLEVKRGAAASVVGRSGRPVTQLSVSELDDLVRLVRHRVL